jgi:Flp pilus assembly protein TadG
MIRRPVFTRHLLADRKGAVAVETAIITPVLALMALGSFEVSNVIARRNELQGAMSEASSIALASEPTTELRRATVKSIIRTSTGLSDDQVTIDAAYRCGSETQLRTSTSACGSNRISSYVKVVLSDTYSPIWSRYGIGPSMQFRSTRYVMIKQQSD